MFRETKVAFVYPAEDEEIILRRIKNKEPGACWRHYFGEIKFETGIIISILTFFNQVIDGHLTAISPDVK